MLQLMLISNDRSIGKKYGVGYKAKSMLYLTPLRIPPLLTLGGVLSGKEREKSRRRDSAGGREK